MGVDFPLTHSFKSVIRVLYGKGKREGNDQNSKASL